MKTWENQDFTGSAIATSVGDRVLSQPVYEVVRDPVTGCLKRCPRLPDSDLEHFYKWNDWRVHCFPRLFPTEETLLGCLAPRLSSGARVLDIGCGDGRFLAALPENIRKHGTELSEGAADCATKRGVRVVDHADVVSGKLGAFDAIVLLDVFEHLTDPHDFVSSLLPSIRPGGLLGISTGDGDYCLQRKRPAQFWYWRGAVHVSMWTEAYSQFLQAETGLVCVFSGSTSHYFFDPRLWLKQVARLVAFRSVNGDYGRLVRRLAHLVPLTRKAVSWGNEPTYWFGRDHRVVLFRKPM